jgi:hypothetical protein
MVDVDPANGQVCSTLMPGSGLSQPTGIDIHRGAAGTAGPVVVDLGLGGGRTCVAGDRSVLQEIAANPGGFYVNVHTVELPNGAIRGQLAPRS